MYHTKWNIREEKYSSVILTRKLEIHIIELSKLENMNNLRENEKELLTWCKFIKNPEDVEDSSMNENEELRKAREELNKISLDEHERWLAEMREKAIMDEIALRKTGYNEGKKEGKIEIVKALLKKNMPIDEIMDITGLTKEEIENLK